MADALVSPVVGGAFWVASGGLIAFCARRVGNPLRDELVPMMGVLGAFVFAVQMINFAIPGTGSSGHLGGGLLLAILLGPHAALLVIASVLTVQAFFFADGGLLALGCNIINLGFFPAFVAYPFIYRPLAGDRSGSPRNWAAILIAAVAALQLGALGVVAETHVSGIAELPFGAFAAMMLPIHLAIGLVEGTATAAVVAFVMQARPAALALASDLPPAPGRLRPVLLGWLAAAAVIGGALSWFASTHPDGLEWAMARVAGTESAPAPAGRLHTELAQLQQQTAVLPDYAFAGGDEAGPAGDAAAWPAVHAGTSLAGIVGGLLSLAVAGAIGFMFRVRARVRPAPASRGEG